MRIKEKSKERPNRNRTETGFSLCSSSALLPIVFSGAGRRRGGGEGAPGNIICQVHDKLNRIWTETASKPICVNCCLKGEEAQGAERNEVGELNRANMQMNLLTWIFAQQILIFHYERQGGRGKGNWNRNGTETGFPFPKSWWPILCNFIDANL